MRPPPALHRPVLLAAALALVATGCTGGEDAGPDRPDPTGTATALAEGLSAADVGAVAFTGQEPAAVQRDLEETVAGLDGVAPQVEVAEVRTDGGAEGAGATAVLRWTWPLSADPAVGVDDAPGEWRYTTRAPLRLVDGTWRVAWSRSVVAPRLREGWTLDRTVLTARRGRVTGQGGTPLVVPRPVVRVGLDKTQVGARRAPASARRLAGLVDVDPGPFVRQVRAAGDEAFVEAIVLRADEVPAALARAVPGIPGARLIDDRLDLAPTRDFAAPVLGRVGPVTAEMVEDDPDTYQAGDVAGLSGLQARYDDRLRGTDGVRVTALGPGGESRRRARVAAQPGEDLALTLDRRLQERAEAVLADVGPASALVAVRPSDGALLVAANGPGTEGANVATYGRYAPGSTFKIVTSLALLRAGLDPDSPVSCPDTLVVDGKRFGNYDGYPAGALGPITLATAVAQSCNTAFIGERGRLRRGDLADAAASLGLGVDHDLGFPAYFGQVPAGGTETGRAAATIGQGEVLASPMAVATVMASVQRGAVVVPRLVDGETATAEADPPTREEAAALRSMLRGVVTGGSGSVLAGLPGPAVIAKTGTAEFQGEDGLATHAWMVAGQGDLAVAAFVEVGDSGSGTAGPLLADFLRAAAG